MSKERELLKKFGSPIYVYHEDILRQRCMEMKSFERAINIALHNKVNVSMHYSIKANSQPAIVQIIKDEGLKVDCMSPGEYEIGRMCGFKPEEMLYVCNNIKASEMKTVYYSGVLICLDSVSQLETFGRNYPGSEVMVRINPGINGVGHSDKVNTAGEKTKFGTSEENLQKLIEVAERYNLHIIGTHQHLGSLFLNDKIEDYITGVKAGLDLVKRYFKNIKKVDLGGGFGVPYKPEEERLDLYLVAKKLIPILNSFIEEYPSVEEFKFEPGRYIPCEAGKLIGTVTAVKHENGINWIGTDIGMNDIIRPAMYGSYHEIILPESTGECMKVNFCGDVCESGDILGEDREVCCPRVEEPVVIENAGAYGYSMSCNYTGRGRAAEVLIRQDGKSVLIRKRESTEDMIKNVCFENF